MQYKLYGMTASGNCYKVRLILAQLDLPYTWVETDPRTGDTRTPEYLAINSNGEVPTLEYAAGRYLPESNAILCYLADGTPFWPTDRLERALALRWMFFEQYSHEPYIAVARFIRRFLPGDHPRQAQVPELIERGNHALSVMDKHLTDRTFFVEDRYGVADMALFAYTHAAGEGGFDLGRFPAVEAWLGRVRATPKFVPL